VRAQSGPNAVSASEVRENLTVAQVEDTRFLSLSYTDADSDRALAVANAAARVFAREALKASEMATDASVWVSAYAPPQALEGPNPTRNGVLATVLGLMLSVGLAFLLESFSGGWGSPEKVERASGVPNFAAVPELARAKRR